jgi:hypothetical protein
LDILLPVKDGQSPKDRARDIERTLDWCRSVGLKPAENDFASNFDKLKTVPITVRTPEERKKEVNKISNFLRNKSGNVDTHSNDYSRLDQILPMEGCGRD